MPEPIELENAIRRLTFPLPLGIDHVHCYLLRAKDGGWILVDAGLGLPAAEARWTPVLASLDGPLERVVVTHFHPDHVGDAAAVAELAGATVFESRLDHEQCARVWGEGASRDRLERHMVSHGLPEAQLPALRRDSDALRRFVRVPVDPEPLDPGGALDGWEIVHLPGHADGHLALLRDGVLIAGDALLAKISPTVGVYPEARPDPLADYLGSLERIVELAPRIAYAGHGEPIENPTRRAHELVEHHRQRLEAAYAAIGDAPRSAYDVSLALFGDELSATERRFAVAETLAHLERLARSGRAKRIDGDRVFYRSSTTPASAWPKPMHIVAIP
jgi:glyoxylase-like metal-dependent hydrolase (beta-lactamase superfamily II)